MRFLVFQHIGAEHPGIFCDFMRADGIAWDVVALDQGEPIPDLSRYSGLLAFGGPANVWQEELFPWLVAEKAAIRAFVTQMQRPYLGICLGHQLLADALGGKVGPMARPEAGLAQLRLTEAGRSDPLFRGLPEPVSCMQWHGAEVKALPDEAVLLVENEACPIQAFRVQDRAYGLQFHVEVEKQSIARWEGIPAYRRALEAIKGPDGQRDFEADAPRHMNALRDTAAILYGRFRALAETVSG